MTSQTPSALVQARPRTGESRWPMALAVLAAGGLRAALPAQLRSGDARWAFVAIIGGAIWLSNVITFGLWYWDLDRGGAAARARGSGRPPAFVFPEMTNA
ncbi:MAG TPA: hypothetical protein VIY52_18545, partial [Streptosporangiaceae bacterium]